MSTLSFSGGFLWPNVEYEYAKLYLLNIPFEGAEKLDYMVYEDGVYAKSKLGNGFDLSQDFLNKLHGTMARGVDELLHGLSKCFIPRHGIIYFDKEGNPVASLTACFECEKIELWSSKEILQHTVDPNNFDLDKADRQIKTILTAMDEQGVPHFDRPESYEAYVDSSKRYKNAGVMNIDMSKNDTLFNKHFNKGQIWLWVNSKFRGKNEFTESLEVKITGGGDKIMYNQLSDGKGSRFIYFSDDNPYMHEGTVVSNKVILPNGVRVGMSLDDIIGTFPVYDGIAWPEVINVKYGKYEIAYHFEKQTLIRIELRAK
ncbi:MAG: hypothetical protein HUJ25_15520 [Crocinitomicaceae bacterium]|nr:hypothetical protein [Crocinitomicaceae bacterium]